MLEPAFYMVLEQKGKGGIKLPEKATLSYLTHEALLFVASRCVPSELLERYKTPNMQVFRNVGNECFIRMPRVPDFDGFSHLDINEDLVYAVMYEVLFLLNKEPFYRNLALDIIAQYNANEGKDIDDVRNN